MKDSYQTITGESTGEFKDKGSKFIAYAYPVFSAEDWQSRLDETRKLHPKSRHHCYAYRLGLDGNNFRANDDGEPSGTAGRPILGQIDSFGLTNVFVVVVRYFGGTLLGTSGLKNAYKNSTAEALAAAEKVERIVSDLYEFTFQYAIMSEVMNAIKKNKVTIVSQDLADVGKIIISIRQSEVEEKLLYLRANIAKIRIEEIEKVEEIEGLEIEFVETR